jgi:predicted nucleotidyltransferase
MKTVGIICEYNVFHNGHKHQIDRLRAMGYDCVVCVMSGNFTQRGELAIADKYTRAEAAIKCGADIVLELPFPFSSFSAEGFATAGIQILSAVGVDAVSFGSECGDTDLLRRAAKAVLSKEFSESYSQKKANGSAAAFFDTLSDVMGDDITVLSNDILAISYISAIEKLGAPLDIIPIKREGASFRSLELTHTLPSATAIRREVTNSTNGFASLKSCHVPVAALDVFNKVQNIGLCPVTPLNVEKEILSFFKFMSPRDIASRAVNISRGGASVAEDGDGLVERLCRSAKNSHSLEDFLSSAYNSRHTDARVNRVMLFSLLGVSDTTSKSLPSYTTLLSANAKGRELLTSIRKSAAIPIIAKPADAPDSAQKDISALADSFYTLAMPKVVDFDYFIKQRPYIANL